MYFKFRCSESLSTHNQRHCNQRTPTWIVVFVPDSAETVDACALEENQKKCKCQISVIDRRIFINVTRALACKFIIG
jgi:hypothetical protein